MAIDIQLKRSTITGTKPSTLQPGEVALNLKAKAMYVGDESGNPQLVTQPTFVGPSSSPITDARDGMIRFDTDSKNMQVFSEDLGGWVLVGFPQAGGEIGDHLTITIDGTTYFETTTDPDTGQPLIKMTNVEVRDDLGVARNLLVEGKITTESLQVNANAIVDGRLTADDLRKNNAGSFIHWNDSGIVSGKVRIVKDTELDNVSGGANGDIYFGYET